MNPKDIMADAIHNFHPQYQQYTQQSQSPTRGAGGEEGEDDLESSSRDVSPDVEVGLARGGAGR